MKNTRRGLGKGLGTGYKNFAPMDSHIHSLSAKGVKTLMKANYTPKKTPKYEYMWGKDVFDDDNKGLLFGVEDVSDFPDYVEWFPSASAREKNSKKYKMNVVNREQHFDYLKKKEIKIDAKSRDYNNWKYDTSRNPYRGFRFEKGNYAVGSQKIMGEHKIFVQKLSGGFPTAQTNFKYVRSKEQAIQLSKRVMKDIDEGKAPF